MSWRADGRRREASASTDGREGPSSSSPASGMAMGTRGGRRLSPALSAWAVRAARQAVPSRAASRPCRPVHTHQPPAGVAGVALGRADQPGEVPQFEAEARQRLTALGYLR